MSTRMRRTQSFEPAPPPPSVRPPERLSVRPPERMSAQGAPSKLPAAVVEIRLETARQDFDAIAGTLHALPADSLVAVTFSLEAAAMTALAVAEFCHEAPTRSHFEHLSHSGEWSLGALEQLPQVARAAWYVATRAQEASGSATELRVSAELITEGTATRKRMCKVLDFLFDDDPKLGPVVRRLNMGGDHRELANDLLRCAEIYGLHPNDVAKVPKHYRPTDRGAAMRVGNDIFRQLDGQKAPPTTSKWVELQQRAATHLLAVYEEVAEAGRFLHRRHRVIREQRFPPLASAQRVARKRTSTEPTPA